MLERLDPVDGAAVTTPLTPGDGEASAPRPPLFAVGQRVAGRYIVEGLLGSGGFGEVYRVSDERADGTERALKVQRVTTSSRAVESLESEFELLASLDHPSLARVHDFGHLGSDVAFFTQELVRGTPLLESSLSPADPEALPLWAELCRALQYLHTRGILHRDVKPSNVIVDLEARRLTLLDFGIAGAFGALDHDRLIGTLAYMAPEAITGGPIDARADVYSLGVTLYRQAAGEVPFRGSVTDVLTAQLLSAPEPLAKKGIPSAVASVIERAMSKQPGARYATALELCAALFEANGSSMAAEPSESLASYVLSARFVGHDAVLDRVIARALGGPRGAIMITGEAGSGKSRLLREARQRVQLARRDWISVAVKRSWAANAVIRDIARAVLDEGVVSALGDDDRRELARALPELKKPRERIGVALDPERARASRITALARAVRRRFEQRPGVLAIEDLHWMPREALVSFEPLLRAISDQQANCLLALSARPGEISDAVAACTGAEQLVCGALGAEAAASLVDSMFGAPELLAGSELGAALADRRHTAQYVQESLRLALDTGAIVRTGESWQRTAGISALTMAELTRARFERLTQDQRRAALALAVLGSEASGPDVARVAGFPRPRASHALRDLVRSGLAEDRRGASYAMHDRYRDVALELCPPAWLRAAHRRAAKLAKSEAFGDWRALLSAAEHHRAAGNPAAAVRAAREGARLAERSGRPDQAALAMRDAIGWHAALGPVPLEMLLRHFDLALLAGESAAVAGALSALEAEEHRASGAEQAEIALRRARLAVRRGDADSARQTCESALSRARELGEERLEAELFLLLAKVDEDYGRVDRALEEYERAAHIAERCKQRAVEARAWLGASLAAVRLATAARGTSFAERALEAAESAGDAVLRAEALRHLGNALRERGDSAGALRLYRRAVRASREGGSPESEAKALNNLGTVCQWVGLVPEALAALQRSLELKLRLGLHASALLTQNNLGALHLAIGRHAQARQELESVIEHERDATPIIVALGYSNSADLCVLGGDFARAIDLYRAAHAMNRERALTGQQSHALSGLVRVLAMRNQPGDLDEARELLNSLERLTEQSDLAEAHRRHHTSAALYYDCVGDARRCLTHARRVRTTSDDPTAQFSDVFGTVLEARWIEAVALRRLGRTSESKRAAERTLAILMRLSRRVGDDAEQRVFLETSPLHRTIRAQRLDTRPGWSWLAEA